MVSLISRHVLRQFLALQVKMANRICERCNNKLFHVSMTTYLKYSSIRTKDTNVLYQQSTDLMKGDNYCRADLYQPFIPILQMDQNEGLKLVKEVLYNNILGILRNQRDIAHRQFTRGFLTTASSFVAKRVNTIHPAQRNLQKQVLVFSSDETLIGKMTLAKAEGMARTDGLKLIDMGVNEDKEQCYKLLTGKEYFKESMKMRLSKTADKKKEEKEFRLTAKITDHDLGIKLNQIREFLQKGRNVKISMKGNRRIAETEMNQLQASLMKKVTEGVQDIATVKKAIRTPTDMTFVLVPYPQQDPS